MATGYSSSAVEDKKMKGSDELARYPCSPCAKQGDDVRAVNYCIDCGEFMCAACKDFHNRLTALAFHEILHKGRLDEFVSKEKPSFPCQRCQVHHGRLVDTYCAEHDEVCCTTCVAIKHRQCDGIDYLPDVAKDVRESKEYQELISSMEACFQTIDDKQKALEEERTTAQKMKEDGVPGVEAYIEKMKQYLSTLESNASRQIEAECEKKEEEINVALEQIHDLKTVLDEDWQKLQDSDNHNDSQMFVYTKAGKTKLKETKTKLEQMKTPAKLPVFLLNTAFEDMLSGVQSLGSFSQSISLYGEFDVTCEDDGEQCGITGSCHSPDSGIILADWANKKLKRLSDANKVTDSLVMEHGPWDMCFVGTKQIAVTLPTAKRVQFLSVGKSFFPRDSFKMGKVCRGIGMKDEKLFIACGGGSGEGPGHLRVYNLRGKHLLTVKNHLFNLPLQIATSPCSKKIYIADLKVGLVSFLYSSASGDRVCSERVPESTAVCATEQHGLFATVASSSIILQVSPELNSCTEAARIKDDPRGFQSLTYDSVNNRLIATMENCNTVTVFSLPTK